MSVFFHSLAYSWGHLWSIPRVTGPCPRSRFTTMGFMLPCSLDVMEQGEQGLPCIPTSPQTWSRGKELFCQRHLSPCREGISSTCLFLRYRNKIQTASSFEVCVHIEVCVHMRQGEPGDVLQVNCSHVTRYLSVRIVRYFHQSLDEFLVCFLKPRCALEAFWGKLPWHSPHTNHINCLGLAPGKDGEAFP